MTAELTSPTVTIARAGGDMRELIERANRARDVQRVKHE